MGSREHGNERMGSIKGGGFLIHLGNYQILKKDSAPYTLVS